MKKVTVLLAVAASGHGFAVYHRGSAQSHGCSKLCATNRATLQRLSLQPSGTEPGRPKVQTHGLR